MCFLLGKKIFPETRLFFEAIFVPLLQRMRQMHYRRQSAGVLLFIFLSMLTFSSLHVHEENGAKEQMCYQCTHHLPHGGHWSLSSTDSHACLLCQFITLSYLAVPVLLTSKPRLLSVCIGRTGVAACHFLLIGKPCPRAPPFILS